MKTENPSVCVTVKCNVLYSDNGVIACSPEL
jgi:hypothetical protein